jgi:formamidopyrimidine-DNA glycosylase
MPEVIEVKTYTDFIRDKILNKTLQDIEIQNGRYKRKGPFEHYKELLKELPLKIKAVESKGKFMYIELSNGMYIGFTLGLSGGWFFRSKGSSVLNHGLDFSSKYSIENKEKYEGYFQKSLTHINVEFKTSIGDLLFYDTLSYGTIKVFKNEDELQKKLNTLGVDIMDEELDFKLFDERIHLKKNLQKPIGNVLVDQKTISGVGNYLRSDALWMAKISPFRKIKDIDEKELKILYHDLRALIWGQYDRKGGVKMKLILKTDKLPEDYKRDFFVYQEEKDVFGKKVVKEELYEGSQVRYVYWVKERQN